MSNAPRGWVNGGSSGRRRPVRKGKRSSPPGKWRLLISESTHDVILEIILNWPIDSPLSWPRLMAVVNHRFQGDWKRQTLAKHKLLQDAFSKRHDEVSDYLREQAKNNGKRVSRTRDEEVEYLKKQLQLVNRENEDLKQRLKVAGERMDLWRHNAFLHRMTPQQLDAPRQENDRGRSDRD